MVVVLLVLIVPVPWQSILTLEVAGQEPLDFSYTIMVLGKKGVGKSVATCI
jgi:hypothetical protein